MYGPPPGLYVFAGCHWACMSRPAAAASRLTSLCLLPLPLLPLPPDLSAFAGCRHACLSLLSLLRAYLTLLVAAAVPVYGPGLLKTFLFGNGRLTELFIRVVKVEMGRENEWPSTATPHGCGRTTHPGQFTKDKYTIPGCRVPLSPMQ